MHKLHIFEVSSSSRWFPCKWRTRARKRHRLSLYGCLVFSSNVRHLIVQFFKSGSGKIASFYLIGTPLRRAVNTVKFVNLKNLHFVLNLSLLHDLMTSVLLRISLSFAMSSLVHTSLDRSSNVLFSCA